MEAVGFPSVEQQFRDDTGIEVSFLIGLWGGLSPGTPEPGLAADYHAAINEVEVPVFSDTEGLLLGITPYDGSSLPGKCALSPDMVILACIVGQENDEVLDAILEDAR